MTFLSELALLSPDLPSLDFGNIFLNAGGVTTRGIMDFDSARGEDTFGELDDSGVFLWRDGENLGIKLFFSPAV